MKYHNLKKGQIYSVFVGRRVFRATYHSRYFNKAMGQWHYVFKSLDKLITYTPAALKVKVQIL